MEDVISDSNATSQHGWTPVHYAAWKNQVIILDLLLRNNGDVNRNALTSDRKPLHLACSWADEHVVRKLLQSQASVDVKAISRGNSTPLHFAARTDNAGAAKVLLEHKADMLVLDAVIHLGLHIFSVVGVYLTPNNCVQFGLSALDIASRDPNAQVDYLAKLTRSNHEKRVEKLFKVLGCLFGCRTYHCGLNDVDDPIETQN